MTKHLTPSRVIIALLVLALVVQMYRRDGGGSSGDYTAAERAARESIVRFAREYEAMNKAVAAAIRRGDFETDQQVVEWHEEHREEAERRAFAKLNDLSERDMPRDRDGRLDRDEAAAFYEAKARGFGSIE